MIVRPAKCLSPLPTTALSELNLFASFFACITLSSEPRHFFDSRFKNIQHTNSIGFSNGNSLYFVKERNAELPILFVYLSKDKRHCNMFFHELNFGLHMLLFKRHQNNNYRFKTYERIGKWAKSNLTEHVVSRN